jgi:peptide-methionine (S)-S-oxide reductase
MAGEKHQNTQRQAEGQLSPGCHAQAECGTARRMDPPVGSRQFRACDVKRSSLHNSKRRCVLYIRNTIVKEIFAMNSKSTDHATFGAGCFWGVEAAFRGQKGVRSTQVGYAGGSTDNPTYRDVCSDRTGHAEVVQVEFDPDEVSYDELLEIFWKAHDPTQVNRQGPDFGSQYRSAVFFHTPEQQAAAEQSKQAAQSRYRRRIATEITAAGPFWRAEEYHQQYLEKRGMGSCHI